MTETSDFGPNPGGLRMLTYRPESAGPNPPLVVVLHGCTQRAEAFARQAGWLTLAERYGFMVVAPEQSPGNNPNRCFNWFEAEDTQRGRGEAASIAAMVAHLVRQQHVDPSRVFVTGLSAGGAMTTVMLATYPDLFAAGAVVAGLPYGVAQGMAGALGAMQGGGHHSSEDLGRLVRGATPEPHHLPRIAIWHGEADHTVRPQNALDLARQWVNAHGLSQSDEVSESPANWSRTVWREPGSNRAMIELNLLPGLGHGTPLSTSGPAGVGSVGPYMLEAGISSSLEIARFWGLADGADAAEVLQPERQDQGSPPSTPGLHAVGDQVVASVTAHVAPAVLAVIEKALKRAGLRS